MKIQIEVADGLEEDEVFIRCSELTPAIQKIQQYILNQASAASKISFYKDNEEFYFPLDEILFFETNGERVYAHGRSDIFSIKYRLYELENILPQQFIRISKSAILNIRHIYSIQRNIAAASLVSFQNSHQQVYVSRSYYKNLKHRLDERNLL